MNIVNFEPYTTQSSGGGVMTAVLLIIALGLMAFYCICSWKLYEKMGEPGWKCLIPIYSSYVLYKHTFSSGWYFLLTLVPVAGTIVALIQEYRFCKCFGKETGFFVLFLFLPEIAIPILAFNDDTFSDYAG